MTGASFDFSGWRVLVAGASRGIGFATAAAFAAAGADVAICARGGAALERARAALAAHGHRVDARRCDLAVAGEVEDWVGTAGATLGGIDVLVNNASGFGFADEDSAWQAGFELDLMAAVRASRAAEAALAASRRGAILHVSSIAAQHPRAVGPAYAALKAALEHYTRSQALALAARGIRVNALAPGSVEFPGGLWDRCRTQDPARHAATLAKIPFGRYGTPSDVARAALFLASPQAGWITGQVLAVDGGQGLNG